MSAVDQHDLLLQLGRHLNPALMGEGVGLQAHSKVRQVDAWLDAERGSGHDCAGIVSLEAIQIHAVRVGLGADAVAQSVYEAVAVAGGGDEPAGDTIDAAPVTGRPALSSAWRNSIAASRASRTMRKICCSRSEGGRPMTATQVMSA